MDIDNKRINPKTKQNELWLCEFFILCVMLIIGVFGVLNSTNAYKMNCLYQLSYAHRNL